MWYLGDHETLALSPEQKASMGELIENRKAKEHAPPSPPSPRSNPAFRHTLNAKLLAGDTEGVALFGSVPPRANMPLPKVKEFARTFAASMLACQPDGVIVYDIQDEEGRDPTLNRPFAYAATHAPVEFARLLSQYSRLETVVYRGVTATPRAEFLGWLTSVWERASSRSIVLVGAGSSKEANTQRGLTVEEASKETRSDPREWVCGGM